MARGSGWCSWRVPTATVARPHCTWPPRSPRDARRQRAAREAVDQPLDGRGEVELRGAALERRRALAALLPGVLAVRDRADLHDRGGERRQQLAGQLAARDLGRRVRTLDRHL